MNHKELPHVGMVHLVMRRLPFDSRTKQQCMSESHRSEEEKNYPGVDTWSH